MFDKADALWILVTFEILGPHLMFSSTVLNTNSIQKKRYLLKWNIVCFFEIIWNAYHLFM